MQLVDVVGFSILVVELAFFARKRSDGSRDRDHDGRSLRILWRSILGGVVVARVLCWMHVGPEYTLGEIGTIVAVAVCVLGLGVRVWAVRTLGRFFTVDVSIREGHELVQAGPYRLVRHPSYTGLIAMFAGWSLTFENYASVSALLIPFSLAIVHRVRIEEAVLARAFGATYQTYRSKTKRLIPFLT